MPSIAAVVASLLLAGAAPSESERATEVVDKNEATDRATLSRLWRGFTVDRLCDVVLELDLPTADGRHEPLQIPLRGGDMVTALSAGLAESRPARGRREKPAKDCRLVLARDPDVVELERRGQLIQIFLAEGDAGPGEIPAPEALPDVLKLTVGPSGLLGLATPTGWGGGSWTLESEPVRKLLVAAVRAEAARSAEIWGDTLPYGLARSRLAEGLALTRLGETTAASDALRACVGLCRKHRRWPFLERAATSALAELNAQD